MFLKITMTWTTIDSYNYIHVIMMYVIKCDGTSYYCRASDPHEVRIITSAIIGGSVIPFHASCKRSCRLSTRKFTPLRRPPPRLWLRAALRP